LRGVGDFAAGAAWAGVFTAPAAGDSAWTWASRKAPKSTAVKNPAIFKLIFIVISFD
jgi:hypothetical protein